MTCKFHCIYCTYLYKTTLESYLCLIFRMNCCCKVILLFGIVRGQAVGSNTDIRIGTIDGIEIIRDNNELNGSKYPVRNENIDLISQVKSNKKHGRPVESTWRCGDDQSYYFEPLNQCYLISLSQFLNIDPERKIAYGGTRNDYMFNCWEQYRGKLLDIGSLCFITKF